MDAALGTAISLKILGAIAGAILALVFLPPKTRTEFIRRATVSMISGVILGEPVRDAVKWADVWQMNLAACTVTAMLSWFAWGAAIRIIGAWKPKE